MTFPETAPTETDEVLVRVEEFVEVGTRVRHDGRQWQVVEVAVRADRPESTPVITVRLQWDPPDPAAEQRRTAARQARRERERLAHRAQDLGELVRFPGAEAMRRRADHKQDEFLGTIDAWFGAGHHDLVQEQVSPTEYVLRLRFDESPPLLLWADEAGEALSRWRKALNYLVHDLAKSAGVPASNLTHRSIQFPIFETPASFDQWLQQVQRLWDPGPWLSDALVDCLRRWQPFDQGASLLVLQDGDNQAKHRGRLPLGVEVRSWAYGAGVFPPDSAPAWEHPHGLVGDGSIVSRVTFAAPAEGVVLDEQVGLVAMVRDPDAATPSGAVTLRDVLGGVRISSIFAFHELVHAHVSARRRSA